MKFKLKVKHRTQGKVFEKEVEASTRSEAVRNTEKIYPELIVMWDI